MNQCFKMYFKEEREKVKKHTSTCVGLLISHDGIQQYLLTVLNNIYITAWVKTHSDIVVFLVICWPYPSMGRGPACVSPFIEF